MTTKAFDANVQNFLEDYSEIEKKKFTRGFQKCTVDSITNFSQFLNFFYLYLDTYPWIDQTNRE